MKRVLIFALLISCGLLLAGETEMISTEARGMGNSADAALKDALSQAVQQAAGAIVDTQTLMKNDEIIQEKILTAGSAIVGKYDIIVPMKQNRNGLFEVKIRALVQQNLLRQKLIEYRIISGKVDGAQNAWAEVVTQKRNQDDMVAMLENVLDKIDVGKYVSFDILGSNGKLGESAALYTRVSDNNQVLIAFGLVCRFNDQRFQAEVMPHLRRVFDALPFESSHEVVIQREGRKALSFPGQNIPMLNYRIMNMPDGTCGVPGGGWKRIILNVSPKFRPNSQQFICYHLPKQMREKVGFFNRLNDKLNSRIKNISVSLCLLDANGEEVHRITRRIAEYEYEGSVQSAVFSCRRDFNSSLVISPNYFAIYNFNGPADIASPLYVIPVQGNMSLNDFKEIKSFRLDIRGK